MKNYIIEILLSVWGYLRADWLILLIGISLAVLMSVYADAEKLKKILMKRAGISTPGAVLLGALTPLCACGTMAVLLSMFVTAMPWGPVMAFLISSPLTSPSEYMFETAFFGSKFAIAVLASSILLGLSAGFMAHFLEKRTNFFKGQYRLASEKGESCCTVSENISESRNCCSESSKVGTKMGCCPGKGLDNNKEFVKKYKLDKLAKEFINIGLKKILLYFIIFIAVGRTVEMIIPQSYIMTLFSGDKAYSIPLAATIGLPLYLNDSSALPLLKSFINSGAGQGAVLAFIITGKATGVPVIAGMSTFLKRRAMLFYIATIYLGGILAGFIFQLLVK